MGLRRELSDLVELRGCHCESVEHHCGLTQAMLMNCLLLRNAMLSIHVVQAKLHKL